jgi:hypothetical protein
MRCRYLLIVVVLLAGIAVLSHAGTCNHAYLAEGIQPPAFDGINTTDTGFLHYFWAWGTNPSDQGTCGAGLVDDGSGIAVNPGILWGNSDACSGSIEGTALLLEAQTTDSGGRFALVAMLAAEGQIDALQAGSLQSIAQYLPQPTATRSPSGTDDLGPYLDYALCWSEPAAGWALSNVPSALAGYAVYWVTVSAGGPVNTGERTLFTRVLSAPGDTEPYITDDSDSPDGLLPASQTACLVRLREGEVYYFAISLIFDGSGSTTGEPQADSSAVETAYLSACSDGVFYSPIFSDGFESGDTAEWSVAVP